MRSAEQHMTDEIPPSPVDEFVTTIKAMAKNRRMILGAVAAVSDYPQMLEDLELMVRERVIIGLRSRWVRRVAVPIFQAQRALATNEPIETRKIKAFEILDQCTDEPLRVACQTWIRQYAN